MLTLAMACAPVPLPPETVTIGAPMYPAPAVAPGLAAGVAFDPWPEPDSPVRFLNLRVAARYVAYTEFSGAPRGTAGNNALVLSLWGALRF